MNEKNEWKCVVVAAFKQLQTGNQDVMDFSLDMQFDIT